MWYFHSVLAFDSDLCGKEGFVHNNGCLWIVDNLDIIDS